MNRRIAGALASLLLSGTAQAEIYRCVVNGKLSYSDTPCAAHAAPAQLPQINTVPAGDSADLAKQYDAEASRKSAAVRKARAAEAEDYAAKKASADTIRRGVVDGRVVAGMTRDQVERILNEPNQIEGQGSARERWIYKSGREHRVVSFKDGVVASDSTHSGGRRR